ncbi:M56 family metallopeptidase [Candidatus Latescibacterota bacterium]
MMTWLDQLSVFAADMTPLAVSFLWQSTLLIVFAGVISLLLRKRGPVIRLSLWIAILAVIPLIPFIMQIAQHENIPRAELSVLPSAFYEAGTPSATDNDTSSESLSPAAAQESPVNSLNPYLFGFILYALGVVILFIGIVFAAIRIRLWERSGNRLYDGHIVDIVEEYRRLFAIKRNVRVIEHPQVTVPCTAGIWRPVIFVPESYETMLSEEQIASVLCHECAHIKRHDVSILAVSSVIRALIWIQPLVWVIQKHIAILAEQSADELVLGTGTNPASYASTLTNIVQNHAIQHSKVLSPVGFIDFKHTFLYRVRAILTYTKGDNMSLRKYMILAVSLVIMVGAVIIVPLTERVVAAENGSDESTTLNLVLIDADTEEPIRGLEMSIYYDTFNEAPILMDESVTDQNGRISFEGIEELDPKVYRITISRDNYSEYPRSAIEPNKGLFKNLFTSEHSYSEHLSLYRNKIKLDKTYTVYLEPALVISGRVVDPDGNPVAGATVDAIPVKGRGQKGQGGNSLNGRRYMVTTDNLGQYSINLPNENIDVRLIAHDGKINEWRTWANGYSDDISLKRHKSTENVTVRLTRPCTISGIVKDPNGKPVPDFPVKLKYPDGKYNTYYTPKTKSDENGRFTLQHVRAGEMLVMGDYNTLTIYHPTKCEWPEGYLVPSTLAAGETLTDIEVLGLTLDEVMAIQSKNGDKKRSFWARGFIALW